MITIVAVITYQHIDIMPMLKQKLYHATKDDMKVPQYQTVEEFLIKFNPKNSR